MWAKSSTSSALCTGAEVAKASYQPPAPLGPTGGDRCHRPHWQSGALGAACWGPCERWVQDADPQGRPGPQPPNAEPAQHLRARAGTETPASRTRNARTAPPRPLRTCASNPGVEWAGSGGSHSDLPWSSQ